MSANKKRKKTKAPKATVNMKTIKRICCVAGVVLIVIAGFLGWSAWQDGQPLLTVAGYEISKEEYRWAMYEARNDVLSEHSANGISPIEWGEETALGMPYEMVAQRAVEILQEFYAVGTLAVERGYLEDASYEAMVQQLEEGNQARSEAISAGEIVTGLSSYTLEQYISYRASGLRRQFCDDTSNPEMELTDEEVRQRYEEDKATYYTMEDSFQLCFIQIYAEQVQDVSFTELEDAAYELRQLTLESGSMKEAVSQVPVLQEYFQEMTLEGENYGAYARGYEDLLTLANELDSGEISQVISENGWLWLVECVERVDNDYQSFESVVSVVKRYIQEDRYDAIIAQRAQEMEVECDLERLYRYTAEQLGA